MKSIIVRSLHPFPLAGPQFPCLKPKQLAQRISMGPSFQPPLAISMIHSFSQQVFIELELPDTVGK